MVSSSIGANGRDLDAEWATVLVMKRCWSPAIGFQSATENIEEPRLIRAVAGEARGLWHRLCG